MSNYGSGKPNADEYRLGQSGEVRANLNVSIPAELRRQLVAIAQSRRMQLRHVAQDAIEEYVRRNALPKRD